jgi:hypothetical protein
MKNIKHSYKANITVRLISNFWFSLLQWLRLLTLSLTRAREWLKNSVNAPPGSLEKDHQVIIKNQFKKFNNKTTIMKLSKQLIRWSTMLLLLISAVNANAQYPNTGNHSVCVGETKLYGVTATAGSTYAWTMTPATGGTITPGASTNLISILWTTPGVYTLQVVETITATGCLGDPQTIQVTVNPLPVPIITGPTPVCQNSSGTYTTEPGMTGYVWTVTGGTITAGQGTNSVNVNWTGAGAQTITVTYVNANGCSPATPATQTITVNALPVPTITGPLTICQNNSGTYTTETGMTGYVWTVTGGTITTGQGTNSVNVNWTGTGAQTITVTYVDPNGCGPTTPTTQTITVNPLPSPTITGPLTICQNGSGTYTTEPGMTGYVWTVTGGTITTGQGTNSVNVNWTGTGAQTITVTYVNANGCSPTTPTTQTVTVNPLPSPTITGPLTICQNSSGTYTTETGMTGYVWTVTGGTITSGQGLSSINVNWTGTGAQTITVTYVNANGCSPAAPTSQTVNINPTPTPVITGPSPVCQTVNNSTETYSVVNVPGNSYNWVVTGGTIVSGQGTNAIVVQWTTAGAGSVQVTESVGTSGCTASATLNVTVNPKPVTTPITHN